jgi:hypothetical protein
MQTMSSKLFAVPLDTRRQCTSCRTCSGPHHEVRCSVRSRGIPGVDSVDNQWGLP